MSQLFLSWCGPCKALEPRLENVIAQRKGEIQLAKVNIDDMGEIAAKYEVQYRKYSDVLGIKKNLILG